MESKQIINKLLSKTKGTYISLTKVKDLGNNITKQSDMRVRVGVSYANMKINENKEVASLPWGHWVEGLENLVIEHKGNYYLRITSSNPSDVDNSKDVIATRYYLNGVEIDRNTALSLADAKKLKTNNSVINNIKFENILQLN